MKNRRIQTKKIYEEVADSLITMIKNGELKPGDQLDSVEQLAQSFDVSRSAVRGSPKWYAGDGAGFDASRRRNICDRL